jgi:hypothetical protein
VKKVLTILTAVLLLASGMHLSFASHYCGGKLAAVRLSVTGEYATCGMERCITGAGTTQKTYSDNCCENHISAFSLGNYESTTSLLPGSPEQKTIHFSGIPVYPLLSHDYSFKAYGSNTSPPGNYCPENLSIPILCVFRI